MALTASERERYSRHLLLPEIGTAGQDQLKAARVLVIGAGGLGSPASLYLAAAGIGTLGLLDHDRVDLSNLQRQLLFTSADVGSGKAVTGQARLAALNPDIEVIAHQLELRADNAMALLGQYDCVLDGSDRPRTRYLVNDACVLLRRPLVSAAIHRFEGQAMSYVPDQGPCYRCLFPRADASVAPSCAEAGVLGVLPGVLGALQATEAIKLILRLGEPLVGRLLTFDALAMQWREFRFTRRQDCAVCGAQPAIRTLADSDAAFGGAAAGRFERLKPRQLQALMERAAGERTPLAIVDVREPREFAGGHLPGAVNIPVNELPNRHAEIPRQTPVVFICRSGVRSQRACELAATAGLDGPGGSIGFGRLADLEGGMLAWAADIDPAMQVAPPP